MDMQTAFMQFLRSASQQSDRPYTPPTSYEDAMNRDYQEFGLSPSILLEPEEREEEGRVDEESGDIQLGGAELQSRPESSASSPPSTFSVDPHQQQEQEFDPNSLYMLDNEQMIDYINMFDI